MNIVPGSLKRAGLIAKTLGPNWIWARGIYEARKRSGLIRRQLPPVEWAAMPLNSWLNNPASLTAVDYAVYRKTSAPAFFFDPEDRERMAPFLRKFQGTCRDPITLADHLVQGKFQLFSHLDVELGEEPNWHRNEVTGEVAPSDVHWSLINDFSYGDIKAIWELSRFGWAYDLVRAYWRTGDERYPERFWSLIEHWRTTNQPNQGANWKCGQETSLRVMAWCFALYGFLHAEATTPPRIKLLAEMIAFSGKRIESTLGYALSQRNNHGVSEGMGLWTIGALFPEFQDAKRWRRKGREVLEKLGHSLVYDDGAFSQHSTNYHRLMLHDYLWSLRLGDILADPFSQSLKDRIHESTLLLYQLQSEENGRVPNYGANDGALLLPLTSTDYSDFRPLISSCRYLLTGKRSYDSGPWDEDLFWLFGIESLGAAMDPPARENLNTQSGYVTLRSTSSFAFTRAPRKFVDRPGNADVLAMDIWWRGENIALDAGTYSYNATGTWKQGLGGTSVHNTVSVDSQDQMSKVGRFLWAPWLHASSILRKTSEGSFFEYFQASHDGYQRLPDPVTHTRSFVRVGADHWLILDEMNAKMTHEYRLHWLLDNRFDVDKDAEKTIRLHWGRTEEEGYQIEAGVIGGQAQIEWVRGSENGIDGWYSPQYLQRLPASSASLTVMGSNIRFWSVFGPGDPKFNVDEAGFFMTLPEGNVRGYWGDRFPIARLTMSSDEDRILDSLDLR